MNWSRGFFRLWIVGALIYLGLVSWLIGIEDFEGLWRTGGKYIITSPHGIGREIDASLPQEAVRAAVISLAREDVRSRGSSEQSATGTNDADEITTRILNYIADRQQRDRERAWRALALALLPPTIVFGVGLVVRWIRRGFERAPLS